MARPAAPTASPAKPKTNPWAVGCLVVLVACGLFVALVIAIAVPSLDRAREAVRSTTTPQPDAVLRDVRIDARCKKGGFGAVALWDVTLTNTSTTTTHRDLRYRSMYYSESGNRLRTNRGAFEIVLKPSETRRLADFNDGPIPQQAARCDMVPIGG